MTEALSFLATPSASTAPSFASTRRGLSHDGRRGENAVDVVEHAVLDRADVPRRDFPHEATARRTSRPSYPPETAYSAPSVRPGAPLPFFYYSFWTPQKFL